MSLFVALPSSQQSRVACAPNLPISPAAVSSAMICPLSIMAMRSHNNWASSMKCVVSRMVFPCSRSLSTISHNIRRLCGSNPAVGSSRNSTCGSLTRAIASARRWPSIYPSSLTLLAAFGFIAAFSLVLRLLGVQKERAEGLLHQLEESNAELKQAHAQLRSYAMEVEELTIVRERARLAREIHDTLGHYLSILNIQLETISKLQEREPARAVVEIAEARRVAAQSMQEVRNAV